MKTLLEDYKKKSDHHHNEIRVYQSNAQELLKRINEKDVSIRDRSKLYNDKVYIDKKIKEHTWTVRKFDNVVKALEKGGNVTKIKDQFSLEHDHIADFRGIPITRQDFSNFDILKENTPGFIPLIDEKLFEINGSSVDCIKINNDSYLFAVNGHRESDPINKEEYNHAGYCIINLDQLVLTTHYYQQKLISNYKLKAQEKTQKEKEKWFRIPEDKRERFLMQDNFYHSLPQKIQKSITQEQFEKLSWQQREQLHVPVKTFRAEKIKSSLDSKHMRVSFHAMYERFSDSSAQRTTKKDNEPVPINYKASGTYANKKVFQEWSGFREMLEWKIKDIKVQNQFDSDIRKKALETSFGNSNTSDILQKDYGILVKRQNGEKIKLHESYIIRDAWYNVQKCFGTLVDQAKDYNLKISYAGDKKIYASKATGIFIDKFKAIAVSQKYGEDDFQSVMAHEVAHWIDKEQGTKIGKYFASNDYDSVAGKLATTFKKNLNFKTNSDYINSIHECFARAMQQHFVMESDNSLLDKQKIEICQNPNFVSQSKYENLIKPLACELKEKYKLSVDQNFSLMHEEQIKKQPLKNKHPDLKNNSKNITPGFNSKNATQMKLF